MPIWRLVLSYSWASLVAQFKESACQSRRGFDPLVGKIPWRRKWQPTPVFLPGKSHGQRSLVGYSPWGRKRVRHNLATKQHLSQELSSSPKTVLWCACVCAADLVSKEMNPSYLKAFTHTILSLEKNSVLGKCL